MKNRLKNLFVQFEHVIKCVWMAEWIEDSFDICIYFSKGKVRWETKETQSFANVNSAEKIRPRVKMNYSSASPTLLVSLVASFNNSVLSHLLIWILHNTTSNRLRSVEDFILFGQPPLFLYKSSWNRTTMSSNNGISLENIPGTFSIPTVSILFPISNAMVNY